MKTLMQTSSRQNRRHVSTLFLLLILLSLSLTSCSSTSIVRKIQADEWYKEYGMQTARETTMPANIPKLLIALTSNNYYIQTESISALGTIGPDAIITAPSLIDAAKKRNSMKFNFVVAEALANMGKDVVPLLIPLLDDKYPHIRKMAVITLGYLGPEAAEAIQPLAQLLGTDKKYYREITSALGKIGPESFQVLFTELKAQDNDKQKNYLIAAVGEIGTAAEPAVPTLLNYFQSNSRLRAHALNALLDIGYTDDDFIHSIINYLHQPDVNLRLMAVDGLGSLGPAAAKAVPDLMNLLAQEKDQNIQMRSRTLNALLNIGYTGKDLILILTDYLHSPDSKVRILSVETLGKLGSAASLTVPALSKLVDEDPDIEVRMHIVDALANIGPAARPSVPVLLQALSSTNANLQIKVLDALSFIADDTETVTSSIQPFLQSENPNLRKHAMFALQNMQHTGEVFIKELESIAANDSHPQNQLKAACILRSLSDDKSATAASSQKARVYFIRPRGILGASMPTGIWDDDHYIGLVPNGSYLAYEVDPGEHLFLTRSIEWSAVKARLSCDREYFITFKTISPAGTAIGRWESSARIYLIPLDACMANEQIEKMLVDLKEYKPNTKKDNYSTRHSNGVKKAITSLNTGEIHYASMFANQGK